MPLPTSNDSDDKKDSREPTADKELAEDAPGFVDAIHNLVNLYEIGKQLLESEDEKVKQRAWEHMLEMKYGKGGPSPVPAEPAEPPRLNFDAIIQKVRRDSSS